MSNRVENKQEVTCASNAYGVKVKRCCASCQHKEITNEGARGCALMKLKVEQMFECQQWQMSDGLKNAGMGGGVVRLKGTTEIILK